MKYIYFIEFTFNMDDLSDISYKEIDEPIIREDSICYIHKLGGVAKAVVQDMSEIKSNFKPICSDEYSINREKHRSLLIAFCYDSKLKSAKSKKKLAKTLCTKEYQKLLNAYIRSLNNKSVKVQNWIQN